MVDWLRDEQDWDMTCTRFLVSEKKNYSVSRYPRQPRSKLDAI